MSLGFQCPRKRYSKHSLTTSTQCRIPRLYSVPWLKWGHTEQHRPALPEVTFIQCLMVCSVQVIEHSETFHCYQKFLQPPHLVTKPHLVLGTTVYKAIIYTTVGLQRPLRLSVIAKLMFQAITSASVLSLQTQRGEVS